MGTPGRRGTVDPVKIPVETTVPRQQLSEVERDLTVRPVHPMAKERGGYQNPTPPATAVSRGLRVLNPPRP